MNYVKLFCNQLTSAEDASMTGETSTVNSQENTPNFGNLIFPLPREENILIRRLEKETYRLNSAEISINFNETCLREGLLSK